MAGHEHEGGQNVMAKTCHKHVGLMLYVRNNKIKSMGNKILVLVGGETKKKECVWLFPPHCRELKKRKQKKSVHPFSFLLAESSKEEGRSSCFMFGLEED